MWAIALFFGLSFSAHIAGIGIAIRRYFRTEMTGGRVDRPAVSLLRPVCGLENNLMETLESSFALDWPHYELVFCVANPQDPAIRIIRQLMASHPQRPSRLLIGDNSMSMNPKLNNLVKGYEAAHYKWIIFADSNVLMPKDYIAQLFKRWTPGTGMVCSPPVGSAPEGLSAEIECAWLNSYQARWQLVADEFGKGFAQGKSMLFHRALLDDAGGIECLGREAAEDAAATKVVRAAGLNVRLARVPFAQPIGQRNFASVWRRQLRWAYLRRVSFPQFFLPEIMAGGALPLLAASAGAALGFWSLWLLPALVLAWYLPELLLIHLYGWSLTIRTPLALVLRDLALPVLWIVAWFGSGFEWRGNQMAVTPLRQLFQRRSRVWGRDLAVPLWARFPAALKQATQRQYRKFR